MVGVDAQEIVSGIAKRGAYCASAFLTGLAVGARA